MDEQGISSYTSPAEKVFAEIPYLGERGGDMASAMPRTDPLSHTIELAAEEVKVAVGNHLHSRNRIAELEGVIDSLYTRIQQLETGVLRAGEGAARISRERARQKVVKGYGANHDDIHTGGQLIRAALGYLRISFPDPPGPPAPPSPHPKPKDWPWPGDWKPSTDRIKNLERAGALIAAEIDRIKREEEE